MSSSLPRLWLIFNAVVVAIGLAAAAAGGVLAWSAWAKTSLEGSAEGEVVDLVVNPRPGRSGLAPVVEYRVGGRAFRVKGKTYSSPPSHSLGEKVKVLYPPDRPEEGAIASFAEQWLAPAGVGGLGLFFLLYSGTNLLRRRRRPPAGAGPPAGGEAAGA